MHYTAPIRKAQDHLQRHIAKQQSLGLTHKTTARRDAVTVAHMVTVIIGVLEAHIYERNWDAQPTTKHVASATDLATLQQYVG